MVATQHGVRGPRVPRPAEQDAILAVVRAPIPLQVRVERTVPNWDPKRKLVNATMEVAQV